MNFRLQQDQLVRVQSISFPGWCWVSWGEICSRNRNTNPQIQHMSERQGETDERRRERERGEDSGERDRDTERRGGEREKRETEKEDRERLWARARGERDSEEREDTERGEETERGDSERERESRHRETEMRERPLRERERRERQRREGGEREENLREETAGVSFELYGYTVSSINPANGSLIPAALRRYTSDPDEQRITPATDRDVHDWAQDNTSSETTAHQRAADQDPLTETPQHQLSERRGNTVINQYGKAYSWGGGFALWFFS